MDNQLNILDMMNAAIQEKDQDSINNIWNVKPDNWQKEEEAKRQKEAKRQRELKKELKGSKNKINTKKEEQKFKFPIFVSFLTVDYLFCSDDFGGVTEVTSEEVRLKLAEDYKALRIKKQVVWSREKLSKEEKEAIPDNDPMKKAKSILYFSIKGSSKGAMRIAHKDDMKKLKSLQQGVAYIFAEDGNYRVLRNKIGIFSVKAKNIPQMPKAGEFFSFGLKKIPFTLLKDIITAFYYVYSNHQTESAAQIFYNQVSEKYFIHYPKQTVSKYYVNYQSDRAFCRTIIPVMDLHSHHVMKIDFSEIDDEDEINGQLYCIIKDMFLSGNELYYKISCRIGLNGDFLNIDPDIIFSGLENHVLLSNYNKENISSMLSSIDQFN
ncbi:hypothetical protein [Vallitalea guaymasensis]|uniref:hypothetical protein n=1 Tax=Vallitalea guaymasensis TaxID=1185412 RepID=UPI000DE422A1|nr:hypothetical protein [Vallitalea guaymasensis]